MASVQRGDATGAWAEPLGQYELQAEVLAPAGLVSPSLPSLAGPQALGGVMGVSGGARGAGDGWGLGGRGLGAWVPEEGVASTTFSSSQPFGAGPHSPRIPTTVFSKLLFLLTY